MGLDAVGGPVDVVDAQHSRPFGQGGEGAL